MLSVLHTPLRAGIPETEMFLPVLTMLPQAAAVLSLLFLTEALVFFKDVL